MKKLTPVITAWIILIAMLLTMVPGVVTRIKTEQDNKNVTVSLMYSLISTRVSKAKLDEMLDKYMAAGIDTITLIEMDMNYLVAQGLASCTKFNSISLENDALSKKITKEIRKTYPNIADDSYVIQIKDDNTKKKVKYHIGKKFSKEDYHYIENVDNTDVYVIHDGRVNLWDIVLGYDEDVLKELTRRGFKIALLHKLVNYKNTAYLADVEEAVKNYPIEFINIKDGPLPQKGEKIIKDNYRKFADIINKYNLTYVVSEHPSQLGNCEFPGYDYIFDKVMGEGGSKKVLRAYETYDNYQDDGSHYKHRISQHFNSTVDRNIRFINITQIDVYGISYNKIADNTLKAAKEYIKEIKGVGYTLNRPVKVMDYKAHTRVNGAAGAVAMVMCLYLMYAMLIDEKKKFVSRIAYIVAIASVPATLVMPKVLIGLYPTVYALIMACFAITLVMKYIKDKKDNMKFLPLFLMTVVIAAGSLVALSIGMGAMLSGIGYYMNNEIFRGIKLSLTVPMAYTAIVAYYMFVKDETFSLRPMIKKALVSEIKVYWVIVAGVIYLVVSYYIKRSGNVNTISTFEKLMRETITDIFHARPRTKEFVVGYPSLMLLVYYAKKYNIKLLKWGFAVGASILTASITNSFCHVFTDYFTICMRVVNGILVGAIVCVAVYIANAVAVALIKLIKEKF